jgi:hypothetical protein
MKSNFTKQIMACLLVLCLALSGISQNVSINILTENSGQVALNSTVLLRVDVTNTAVSGTVVANKVRPQISVPASISVIPASGHTLPSGWTITSNTGSVIRVTNTSDPIPAGTTRTILIAIQGTVIGGPLQILANLTFVGAAPTGDNAADNTSSSSIEVTNPTPVQLGSFSASLENCRPVLNWVTETELNTQQFEIERAQANNTGWEKVGTVAALGYSASRARYSFVDAALSGSNKKVLYRLKMVDRDGRYEYSPTLPVSLNCNTISVSVFPNPVQGGKLYVGLTGTNGRTQATLRKP